MCCNTLFCVFIFLLLHILFLHLLFSFIILSLSILLRLLLVLPLVLWYLSSSLILLILPFSCFMSFFRLFLSLFFTCFSNLPLVLFCYRVSSVESSRPYRFSRILFILFSVIVYSSVLFPTFTACNGLTVLQTYTCMSCNIDEDASYLLALSKGHCYLSTVIATQCLCHCSYSFVSSLL